MNKKTKYIFITGGVVSSLGKGLTAASLARLLVSRGYKIVMQKIDPYLNIDPGTMSPYEHGEVYVTDDGAETDLDLGHYERFSGLDMTKKSSITAGRIYWNVLQKERKGEYLGQTIQMIPHITDEIKKNIRAVADDDTDIILCEVGGTVGDIEGMVFLEAIRQIGLEVGRANVMFMHVTYLPFIKAAGELKTKPTQNSVAHLRHIGITPDTIICRAEQNIMPEIKEKLSLFCNVPLPSIIEAKDVEHSIYELPIIFKEQQLDLTVINHFGLQEKESNLNAWHIMLDKKIRAKEKIKIALVGKYIDLPDAYKSIDEALEHAATHWSMKLEIKKIDAQKLENENPKNFFHDISAILVPGGFGDRGILGKIKAIAYARVNQVPFFGICLGMQCAVIEFARNVLCLNNAHSTEFDPNTESPLICLMDKQRTISKKGGTMRLGAWPCSIKKNTKAYQAYNKHEIQERHRHRYEVNPKYIKFLEERGLLCSGKSPDGGLVELIELKDHPWFVACQYHPEFKSSPLTPHPLFSNFIWAAIEYEKRFFNESNVSTANECKLHKTIPSNI